MCLSAKHRKDARALAALVVVLGLLAVAASKTVAEPLAQPLAWQALPEGNIYEYSGLSATGLIYEINRTRYNIAVISAKPFWAMAIVVLVVRDALLGTHFDCCNVTVSVPTQIPSKRVSG